VDLVVGEVQQLALLGRQLDDNRPWASVDMHEPAVVMARDAFVIGDAELGHGLTLRRVMRGAGVRRGCSQRAVVRGPVP
jgi:hypothetical protein